MKKPSSIFHLPHSTHLLRERGFTLAEMLAVVGIVGLMTVVVLARQQAFNGIVLLENLTYDIALSVREAQVFGTSVRGFDPGPGTQFSRSYGVSFNQVKDTEYVIFVDSFPISAGDDVYSNGDDIIVESFLVGDKNRINDFCASRGAQIRCASSPGNQALRALHIAFERPDPDAIIKAENAGGVMQIAGSDIEFDSAEICVQAPSGEERSVVVTSTGLISLDECTRT